jgi:hypothetical protein
MATLISSRLWPRQLSCLPPGLSFPVASHLLCIIGHDADRDQGRSEEELLIREAREYLSISTQHLQEALLFLSGSNLL